jgi:predicted secreted protein
MAILGTNVILYYYNGTTNIPFAASTNCSFDVSVDQTEVTSTSSAWFKEFKSDIASWTLNCDGLITLGDYDYKDMLDHQLARTSLVVRFSIGTSTTYTIQGTVNIESLSISGPMEAVSTYSISLQGSGPYTIS